MSSSTASPPLASFVSFGELLRYLRRRARLSQRELSIAVGYSESQISRLENNQSAPDPATLAAVFVPALLIKDEAETAARLLKLAAEARHKETSPSLGTSAVVPPEDHRFLLEHLNRSPLIGRADQQRRLAECLDRLASGTGSVVLVSGEPGIGKTRLLDETIAAARKRGMQVLTGRCHERDVAIPYLPIADALEAHARRCAPADWERLLQAAGPEIGVLMSDNLLKHAQFGSIFRPETSTFLTVQAEARPTRAVRKLLNEIARETPVVLVVDDLHWADPLSLELIHHLALYTREIPVLILGAYREIELKRTHPLSQLLVDLNRERLLVRERLRRLNQADTQTFLSELLSGSPLSGLAELIHEETDGNPFFIEELVNGLIEAGRLVWDEQTAHYVLAPGVAVERLADEVPQGVRAAIGARLNYLDTTAQQALGLASVIGRRFSVEVLNRLATAHELNEAEVELALERAVSTRFITALDARLDWHDDVAGFTAGAPALEADFEFDHPLIHQVVYAELDRRRKRHLHAEVGYILEDLYRGQTGLYAERLAYHFLESDNEVKALQYSQLAGDKSMLAYYDPDLALSHYLSGLHMVLDKEVALRRLAGKSPISIRHGALHQFTAEEREAVINYLDEVLQAVSNMPAAKAVAQLASRICVVALHAGPVYEASARLYEQNLLGPDAQKLVIETERGKLVGILEFPGPGRPYPLVLMFHGSPYSKETLAEEAQRYLARGLATFRVDLPGYGETTIPDTHSVADAEILKEMVTAVLAHDRVDPSGVGIVGWSWGPWYGAHLCARDDRIRALVAISPLFDPLDTRPGIPWPEALSRAFQEARWKSGKLRLAEAPSANWTSGWSAASSAYLIAHQIRCPVLLVYGALEPERYRANAEEFAALAPKAQTRAWRSGVHVLFNVPEALEDAAEWMKQQLLG